MSRVCQVTGKRPAVGNNRSHAKMLLSVVSAEPTNSSFLGRERKTFVKLRLTAKGMRIIDKKGIDAVLVEIRARGENV